MREEAELEDERCVNTRGANYVLVYRAEGQTSIVGSGYEKMRL